ncbi:hypothetical protein [Microbulbifer epialgicus]|uniref:Uncharacterized protein n=1 Tax=Microbulbifer epialgicus TaxID=393907 RepID=A0ABV4NTP5_9GAMM
MNNELFRGIGKNMRIYRKGILLILAVFFALGTVYLGKDFTFWEESQSNMLLAITGGLLTIAYRLALGAFVKERLDTENHTARSYEV